MKTKSKANLLNGVVVPTVDSNALAQSVVLAMADAKSISEQMIAKFDALNVKVAEIVQSGIEFGSTNAKAHESIMASRKGDNVTIPDGTSFATVLWVNFEIFGGYSTANAKQMVSLVGHATKHKVRIMPGFMNLTRFIEQLPKGVPALEDANKIVKVKASGRPTKGKKAGSRGRVGRTAVHASKGLVTAMGQEGFGTLLRGIVNSLDFDALSDDGIITAIWEYLVTLNKAKKNDKGNYSLV